MASGAIHVDTSGWIYGHWKGTFYHEDLSAAQRLLLGAFGVSHVIHDFDGWTPRELTADTVCVRFQGPAGPYRGRSTLETLGEWTRLARGWVRQGRDVWCFFNNDQVGYAAFNAIEMRDMVEAGLPTRARSAEKL